MAMLWFVVTGVKLYDGVVELPVEFYADEAGVYPCQITLKSDDDIRIYYIECSIVLTGTTAELVFTTAVMQSTSQDIPIVSCGSFVLNLYVHAWMCTDTHTLKLLHWLWPSVTPKVCQSYFFLNKNYSKVHNTFL